MIELLGFVRYVLNAYWWIVIAAVVFSWLLAFNVINYSNPMVRSVWQGITAVTDPLLKPIRKLLPNSGGLDFSTIVLLMAVTGVTDFLIPYLMRILS